MIGDCKGFAARSIVLADRFCQLRLKKAGKGATL